MLEMLRIVLNSLSGTTLRKIRKMNSNFPLFLSLEISHYLKYVYLTFKKTKNTHRLYPELVGKDMQKTKTKNIRPTYIIIVNAKKRMYRYTV